MRSRKSARVAASAATAPATQTQRQGGMQKLRSKAAASTPHHRSPVIRTQGPVRRPLMMRAEAFCADKAAEHSRCSPLEDSNTNTSTGSRKRKRRSSQDDDDLDDNDDSFDSPQEEDLENLEELADVDLARSNRASAGKKSNNIKNNNNPKTSSHTHLDPLRAAQLKYRAQYMREVRSESLKLKAAVLQRYADAEAAGVPYESDIEQDPEEYVANLRHPSDTPDTPSVLLDERLLQAEFWEPRVRKEGIGGTQALVCIHARFPQGMLPHRVRTKRLSDLFATPKSGSKSQKTQQRASRASGSSQKVQKLKNSRSFQKPSERASGSLQEGSDCEPEGSDPSAEGVNSADEQDSEKDVDLEDDQSEDVVIVETFSKPRTRATRASARIHASAQSPKRNANGAGTSHAATPRGRSAIARGARVSRSLRAATRKSKANEAYLEALAQALSTPSAAAMGATQGTNSRGKRTHSTLSTPSGAKGAASVGRQGGGYATERGGVGVQSTMPRTMPLSAILSGGVTKSQSKTQSQAKGKGKGGEHSKQQRRRGKTPPPRQQSKSYQIDGAEGAEQQGQEDSGSLPMQVCALLEVAAQRTQHAQHGGAAAVATVHHPDTVPNAQHGGDADAHAATADAGTSVTPHASLYAQQVNAHERAAHQQSEQGVAATGTGADAGAELARSLSEELFEELYAHLEMQVDQSSQQQAGASGEAQVEAQVEAGPSHGAVNAAAGKSDTHTHAEKQAQLDDVTAQIAAKLADPHCREVHTSTSVQKHTAAAAVAAQAGDAGPSALPVKYSKGGVRLNKRDLARVKNHVLFANNGKPDGDGYYFAHLPERSIHARAAARPRPGKKYPASGRPPPLITPHQSKTLRSIEIPYRSEHTRLNSERLRYPSDLIGRTAPLHTIVKCVGYPDPHAPKKKEKVEAAAANLAAPVEPFTPAPFPALYNNEEAVRVQHVQPRDARTNGAAVAIARSPVYAGANGTAGIHGFAGTATGRAAGAGRVAGTAGAAAAAAGGAGTAAGATGAGRVAGISGVVAGAASSAAVVGTVAAAAAAAGAASSQAEQLRTFLSQLGPLDQGAFDVLSSVMKQSPGAVTPTPQQPQHVQHTQDAQQEPQHSQQAQLAQAPQQEPQHLEHEQQAQHASTSAVAAGQDVQDAPSSAAAEKPMPKAATTAPALVSTAGTNAATVAHAMHAVTAAQHAAQQLASSPLNSNLGVCGRKSPISPAVTKETNSMHASHAPVQSREAQNQVEEDNEDLLFQDCLGLDEYYDSGIEDEAQNRNSDKERHEDAPPGVVQSVPGPKPPTIVLPDLRAYVAKSSQPRPSQSAPK